MSRVRSSGNATTELKLLALLRAAHVTGWQRNQCILGKPDFAFRRERVAVFVDGCFWHGCPKHRTKPANNTAFWRRKLAANKARDRRVTRTLRRMGWRVVRIWEHELARRNESRLAVKINRMAREPR
jgi:DNA mismatch endonuclease (patch repair protein)